MVCTSQRMPARRADIGARLLQSDAQKPLCCCAQVSSEGKCASLGGSPAKRFSAASQVRVVLQHGGTGLKPL